MNFQYIPHVPAEQIRQLPTRDVALLLLHRLASGTGYLQYASTMTSTRQAFQEEPDTDTLVNRLSDAWCWLEAHALLSREPSQSDAFRRISDDGRDLAKDPQGITRFEARERLSGPLHPALEDTVRTNFDLGDYETACFAAMKAVEVSVRDASGLDNSLVGVKLMRAAFQPHQNGKVGGPLADAGAEGGEQEAVSRCSPAPWARTRIPPATVPSTSTTRSKPPRSSSSPTCCCDRSNAPSAARPR